MVRSGRDSPVAFTLVELLVVIGIIAVLVAVLLPALNSARQGALVVRCAANQRQVMLGFHLYANEYRGFLPYQARPDFSDWSGAVNLALKSAAAFRCPLDSTPRRVPLDLLPSRSYAVNSGKWTYLGNGYRSPWPAVPTDAPRKLADIPNRVFVIGENHGHDSPGGSGWAGDSGAVVGIAEFEGLDAYAWDLHRGRGANYGFSDGHVEFRDKSDVDRYRADTDYGGDVNDPWKWKPQ